MSTRSIQKIIYENGCLTQNARFIQWDFNIYFEKSTANKLPGKYIFSDDRGYHVEDVGDRGGIVNRRLYDNIDDLAYDVYKFMIWLCACDYVELHKSEKIDRKDLMTNYQLDLMRRINKNYYNKFLKELDII